jgi:hypothetical protein
MTFIDLGDQFIALQAGRRQSADDGRHFGLVADDKEALRAALQAAGVKQIDGLFWIPRPLGQPHHPRATSSRNGRRDRAVSAAGKGTGQCAEAALSMALRWGALRADEA